MAKKNNEKSIDNVSVDGLDMTLRICGHNLDRVLIDKIIDMVELLEDKGDHTTLRDICKLKSEWKH